MSKYPGRVLSATPPAVSQSGASGVWTQEEVAKYNAEGVWPQQPLPYDPYFQNVTLLLHGDGNQGATNFSNISDPVYLAFKDNSSNNFPITVNGDAYGDNFGPYALDDGYWSNYFDGTGDDLTVSSNAALQLASESNWTVEFWGYFVSSPSDFDVILGKGTGSGSYEYFFEGFSDNTIDILYSADGTTTWTGQHQLTPVLSLGQWFHFAAVRNGATFKSYVNGVEYFSGSSFNIYAGTGVLNIGGYSGAAGQDPNMYLSNVRIVKGTAVYTSNFTPSTTPLTAIANTSLLTCQSNRFVDNSTNNFTITPAGNVATKVFNPFGELPDGVNGSGYFDGSGDFIGYPTNTALAFGTGDYTVECWVYFTAINSTDLQILFSSGSTGDSFFFHADGNQLSVGTSSVFVSSQSATFVIGTWYHVAACRSGGTLRLFQNGVQVGSSVSDSTNWVSSGTPRIGANGIGTQTVFGYVSNSRVVKGTALYTANFTPPTAPLTNITNTSLLTCQYAGTVRNVGFIDSGPYDFPITRYGNTTQGSFSPFSKPAGRWGARTNDREFISIPASADFDLIGTDFTVEFWLNWNLQNTMASSGTNFLGNMSVSNGYFFGMTSTSSSTFSSLNFTVWNAGSATSNVNTSITQANLPAGEWHHVAIIRSGSSLRFYIDGVHTGSTFTSVTYSTAGGTLTMGSGAYIQNGTYSGNADYFISNLRLTKSAAVYDFDGFTPPTSPLTALASTTLLMFQDSRFINNGTNTGAITSSGHTATRTEITPYSPFPLNTITGAYNPTDFGGSGYFDGSGDYLTLPAGSAFAPLTGDFTIDGWFYLTATGDGQLIWSQTISGTNYFCIFCDTSTPRINFTGTLSGGGSPIYSPSNLQVNAWNYFSVRRSSGTVTVHLNGVDGTPASNTVNFSNVTYVPTIGRYTHTGTNHLTGYISNLRYVRGTAITPSNIPTAPSTSVSGTSLLCNFTNAGIYDNTCFNNLETVANAQVDTSIVKFGTGSMKFDGTGDYLIMPDVLTGQFFTGDFTVEYWDYHGSQSTNYAPQVGTLSSATPAGTWRFGTFSNNGGVYLAYHNGSTYLDIQFGSTAYNDSTWRHFALTRSGTTVRAFVNGVQVGTDQTVSQNFNSANRVIVGAELASPTYFNGYIDDLRITKGIARYTTNFDPPTLPFRNIGA